MAKHIPQAQTFLANRLLDVFQRVVHLSDPLISSFWLDSRIKKGRQHHGDGDLIAHFRLYEKKMNDWICETDKILFAHNKATVKV